MTGQRARRRIELGWFEAVVLLIGYVASLGLVGVAGIYIGQRAVHQHFGRKERLIRLPISAEDPSAQMEPESGEPDITFYNKLGRADVPTGEGRIIVGPPRGPEATGAPGAGSSRANAGAAAPVAAGRATLNEPVDRMGTPADAAAPARPEAPKVPGRGAGSGPEDPVGEPPNVTAGPAPSTTPGSAERVTPEVAATARAPMEGVPMAPERRPEPERDAHDAQPVAPRAPSPPPRVTPEAAATARGVLAMQPVTAAPAASRGTWSVQVNATKEESVAKSLAERLRERGYDAFIVEQLRDGVVWYRVRVGRLPSIEMANALVTRIKQREGLPHAFVASD